MELGFGLDAVAVAAGDARAPGGNDDPRRAVPEEKSKSRQ